MLQRIYGTAWAKKEEQEAYLRMIEEAEKRDHRRLGTQLDLFHLQEEAPGMVFWHPKAGRSGSRSSSTCVASTGTTAISKCAAADPRPQLVGEIRSLGKTTRS